MSTDKRARLVQFIEESVYKFTEAETATFGGSGVTFLTFLIQRHDRKTDKRQEEYAELSRKISEIADAVRGQGGASGCGSL